MEFSYTSYYIRYAINPNDFILRFEDKSTRKVYEGTFHENDFRDYSVLGGFDFVANLILEAFQQKNAFVSVKVCEVKEAVLACIIDVALSILPKPIHISLNLTQVRRATVSDDLTDLSFKVTRNENAMNEKFVIYDKIVEKAYELEQTIQLLKNNTSQVQKNESTSNLKMQDNRFDNAASLYERLFAQEKKTDLLIKLGDRVTSTEKNLEQMNILNTRMASIFEHMKLLKGELAKGLEQIRLSQKPEIAKPINYTMFIIKHSDMEEGNRETLEQSFMDYMRKGWVPYGIPTQNVESQSITLVKYSSMKDFSKISAFKIIYAKETEKLSFEQEIDSYLGQGWHLHGNGCAIYNTENSSAFSQFLIKYE